GRARHALTAVTGGSTIRAGRRNGPAAGSGRGWGAAHGDRVGDTRAAGAVARASDAAVVRVRPHVDAPVGALPDDRRVPRADAPARPFGTTRAGRRLRRRTARLVHARRPQRAVDPRAARAPAVGSRP